MPRDFLTFPMKEERGRQFVGRGRSVVVQSKMKSVLQLPSTIKFC